MSGAVCRSGVYGGAGRRVLGWASRAGEGGSSAAKGLGKGWSGKAQCQVIEWLTWHQSVSIGTVHSAPLLDGRSEHCLLTANYFP